MGTLTSARPRRSDQGPGAGGRGHGPRRPSVAPVARAEPAMTTAGQSGARTQSPDWTMAGRALLGIAPGILAKVQRDEHTR